MYNTPFESYERVLSNAYFYARKCAVVTINEMPQQIGFTDVAPQMSWDITQEPLNGFQKYLQLWRALTEGSYNMFSSERKAA